MLLGITDKDEFLEHLDEEACDDKIWVNLDPEGGELVTIHENHNVLNCSLGGLDDELRALWKKIDALNSLDLRQSTYQVSEGELMSCCDIAEAIETAIDRKILYWVRNFKKNNKTYNPETDYTECKKTVVEHSDVIDRPFIEEFVDTQMFAYYFD
jgi:hypothetical protein